MGISTNGYPQMDISTIGYPQMGIHKWVSTNGYIYNWVVDVSWSNHVVGEAMNSLKLVYGVQWNRVEKRDMFNRRTINITLQMIRRYIHFLQW